MNFLALCELSPIENYKPAHCILAGGASILLHQAKCLRSIHSDVSANLYLKSFDWDSISTNRNNVFEMYISIKHGNSSSVKRKPHHRIGWCNWCESYYYSSAHSIRKLSFQDTFNDSYYIHGGIVINSVELKTHGQICVDRIEKYAGFPLFRFW